MSGGRSVAATARCDQSAATTILLVLLMEGAMLVGSGEARERPVVRRVLPHAATCQYQGGVLMGSGRLVGAVAATERPRYILHGGGDGAPVLHPPSVGGRDVQHRLARA